MGRLRPLATRSMMLELTSVLPMPTLCRPLGAVGEEVLDADSEVVVGVEQAGGCG